MCSEGFRLVCDPSFLFYTKLTTSEDAYFKYLLDSLKNDNETDFLSKYRSTDSLKNYNDIQTKLLISALKKNTSTVVIENILCNITDIKYETSWDESKCSGTIITDICKAGNVEAFKILLHRKNLAGLPSPKEILSILICSLDEDLFEACFDIFLDVFNEFDLNEVNESSFSLPPLGLAYRERKTKVIQKLLKAGTYIGPITSRLPLAWNPQILKEYFDSSIGGELTDWRSYITFNYKNLVPPQSQPDLNEMLPMMQIINSKEHLDLLKHPLITSFMDLKWQQISKLLFLNLFLYCFYLISIVSYIILTTGDKTESGFTNLTWWFTIFGTAYLIVREAIQLRHPKGYIKKHSNYLELLLIFVSILIITIPSVYKEIIVFGILLIALEFWILVRNLPIFSTDILMLEEVLKSFIKSFSLYSIFVFTFALCFYVNFGPERKFENIFISVVKTMAMVVGELNFTDLKIEGFCSYSLILLFIICMAVVLMNLLNGLAFSDIQAIRQQAELNGIICRAKFLYNHDFKLFDKKRRGGDPLCSCMYYVSGIRLAADVPNNNYLPFGCFSCFSELTETNREQRIWFRFLQKLYFWMGNQLMKSSIIAESKTIIMNRMSSTSKEQNQFENLKDELKNKEATAENMIRYIKHIQEHSQIIDEKVTITANKADNIERDVYNVYYKSVINEQDVTNIKKEVKNIKPEVENIQKEQQNIGKNVEKILKILQTLPNEITPQT